VPVVFLFGNNDPCHLSRCHRRSVAFLFLCHNVSA
jgi:hypothetical protein